MSICTINNFSIPYDSCFMNILRQEGIIEIIMWCVIVWGTLPFPLSVMNFITNTFSTVCTNLKFHCTLLSKLIGISFRKVYHFCTYY